MFENGFPSDWSTLKKLIWLRGSGAGGSDLPWTEFTGNPLEFDAPKAHSLKSCVVTIEPIQSGSGDPSPDNIRPISGWTEANVWGTGENLLDFKAALDYWGATYTDNGDGSYTVTAIGTGYSKPYAFLAEDVAVSASATIVNDSTASGWGFDLVKSNGSASGQVGSGSSAENKQACKIRLNYGALGNGATFSNVMLNLGSTASPYSPYSGSSLTIPFGQTVYGGNASYNGDGTWTVTVDRAYVTLDNTNSWQMYASGKFYVNNVTSGALGDAGASASDLAKYISNQYLFSGTGNSSSNAINVDKRFYGTYKNYNRIWVYDSQYSTLDAFTTALASNPLTIVYPIATPTTFTVSNAQLFDALQGRNVMWTDCNNLTIEARGTAVTP